MKIARWKSILAWSGGLLLLALHLDFWRSHPVRVHFGWLPEELLYRLVWMLLAWVYLMFLCSQVWRDEQE